MSSQKRFIFVLSNRNRIDLEIYNTTNIIMSKNKNYFSHLIGLFLILSFSSLNAQVNGNGKMVTKSFDLENITRFVSNFYADITLDMAIDSEITITAESNIIDLIGIEVDGKTLNLDQKKWIEPSKRIRIIVGVPNLSDIVMDTNDEMKVVNISADVFNVSADIGNVIMAGEVNDLRVKSKNGTIEASELESKIASVSISGDGWVVLNTAEQVDCDLSEYARLTNINKDAELIGCAKDSKTEIAKATRYIDIKIKNNSFLRKHFVVVGPKPDGSNFSYGFPMMPGGTKSEKWTIGTKIYKENSVGGRNLLVTLTEEDEGQTVKLFD